MLKKMFIKFDPKNNNGSSGEEADSVGKRVGRV